MARIEMRAQDLLELYQLTQVFYSTYGDSLGFEFGIGITAWNAFLEERYKVVTGGKDIVYATNPRNAGRPAVYSNEQNARVVMLREKGLSLRRIALEVGCSLAHVQTVLAQQK